MPPRKPGKKRSTAVIEHRPSSDATTEIVGHEDALAFFSRVKGRGTLAHAYCISGPEGVGKTAVARRVAAEVLGVSVPESHPDFLRIERGRDPKTGALRRSIDIDQVRDAIELLSRSAFLGGWKVCIVSDVEHLGREAANALLKTLEEPRPRSLLLLTASAPEAVLPTIASRCQQMALGRVATARIATALVGRGAEPGHAELVARLADGAPGTALTLHDDPAALESLRELRDAILDLPLRGVAERFGAIERFVPAKLPFNDAAERARRVLDVASSVLRDAMLARHAPELPRTHADADEGLRRIGAIDPVRALQAAQEARELIDANVSPRAALERLMLALG